MTATITPRRDSPRAVGAPPSPAPQHPRTRRDQPSSILLLPAVVLYSLFALVPLGVAGWLSFTSWDAISDPTVERFQPAWTTRAHLLAMAGRRADSAQAYRRAIELTKDPGVADYLSRRLGDLP